MYLPVQAQSIGRLISFSQVLGIGTPPTPHPQTSVPPSGAGERGTRARETGGGGSPNSDEWKYTVVLFLYPVRTL